MATYRTVLPPPDSEFYGEAYDTRPQRPGWRPGKVTVRYVPWEECIEKIREVALAFMRPTGEIVVEFEVDDQYELAVMVKDLESELNAYQYWQTPIAIDRPRLVKAIKKVV